MNIAKTIAMRAGSWFDRRDIPLDHREEEVASIIEPLVKYARHSTGCRKFGPYQCTCGFNAALESFRSFANAAAAKSPSTYKDALPGEHHPRCHTIQYGSNESHCDCGFTKDAAVKS
jgi:hypothetical protein